MPNLSNNQRRSLRRHCDNVVNEIQRADYETREQYLKNLAGAACRRSQLARGQFTTRESDAINYCIAYITKNWHTADLTD